MQDVYWLGPCPAEEDAVQVGSRDYAREAKKQCRRFIEAIRSVCGSEPEGARLTVKSQPHDFGQYYEVAVVFDGNNEAAVAYAAKCDEHAPVSWPEQCAEEGRIRFQSGTVVATVGAKMVASQEQIRALVDRHISGDWGDVDSDDAKANERSVKWGDRVVSSYQVGKEKLWVVTEADRTSTTVMTLGEY